MWRVRSAAAAMNISGQAMISKPAGVMLADPGLVIVEPVEMLQQLHVAVDRQQRVLMQGMEGSQKDAGLQKPIVHVAHGGLGLRRGCLGYPNRSDNPSINKPIARVMSRAAHI